jgi:hypothetical protein
MMTAGGARTRPYSAGRTWSCSIRIRYRSGLVRRRRSLDVSAAVRLGLELLPPLLPEARAGRGLIVEIGERVLERDAVLLEKAVEIVS